MILNTDDLTKPMQIRQDGCSNLAPKTMILGAIAGAGYLYLAAPSDWTKKYQLGLTSFDPEEVNWVQAVQIESAATLLLVLLMLVISDPDENREFEVFIWGIKLTSSTPPPPRVRAS